MFFSDLIDKNSTLSGCLKYLSLSMVTKTKTKWLQHHGGILRKCKLDIFIAFCQNKCLADESLVRHILLLKAIKFVDMRRYMEGVGLLSLEDGTYVIERESATIPKFLNRLLGLPVHAQNALFQYFSDIVAELVAQAKHDGTYDSGIMGWFPTKSYALKLYVVTSFVVRIGSCFKCGKVTQTNFWIWYPRNSLLFLLSGFTQKILCRFGYRWWRSAEIGNSCIFWPLWKWILSCGNSQNHCWARCKLGGCVCYLAGSSWRPSAISTLFCLFTVTNPFLWKGGRNANRCSSISR